MYAVMETGGKQYRVQVGDVVFVEKLECEADSKISIDKVVMVSDENGVKVGAPYVDGASIEATVLKNGKSKKITVFTYKAKKNEKQKIYHYQRYHRCKSDGHGLFLRIARLKQKQEHNQGMYQRPNNRYIF